MEKGSASRRERAAGTAVWANLPAGTDACIITRLSDGVVVAVNAAACAMLGVSADHAVGRSGIELGFIDPAGRERTLAQLREAPPGAAVEVVRSVGEQLIEARILQLDLNGVQCGLATLRDVTARERALDERDLLDAVLDSAPAGFLFCDRDLRVVRWNALADRAQTLEHGMRLEDVPNASPEAIGAFRRVLASGAPIADLEVAIQRADRIYRLTIFPVRSHRETTVGVGCIYVEVTAQRAATEALRESERRREEILFAMLQAEETERGRIATALHDDTVQVMTAALMSLDRVAMVARRAGDPNVATAVSTARITLEEAAERTRRLMFELRPAVLQEHGVLAAVELLADQVARETGARATVEGTRRRYGPVTEQLLYRAFQEALANVRKHSGASRIRVRLTEHNGTVESEVRDDGRGFDPDEARGRAGAHLHMGLETLAERMRAGGGTVAVDSARGAGTTVRFAVPAS